VEKVSVGASVVYVQTEGKLGPSQRSDDDGSGKFASTMRLPRGAAGERELHRDYEALQRLFVLYTFSLCSPKLWIDGGDIVKDMLQLLGSQESLSYLSTKEVAVSQ
jgi:hypothetical protein